MYEPVWEIWIAIYLFMAGAGAGAFVTAAIAEALGVEDFKPLVKGGALISGPLVALSMPNLIIDLGIGKREPWRIPYLFIGNPRSVMFWGAWLLSLFIPVALMYGALEFDLIKLPDWWTDRVLPILRRFRPTIVRVGTLLSVGVAVYTGLLIGAVRAIPLWNTTILPMLFLVSALSTGMAAAVITSEAFAMTVEADGVALARRYYYVNMVHSLLIVIETVFIFCWLFLVAQRSEAAAQSVHMLLFGQHALLFWIGIIFFGIVDPMIIYIYEVVLHRPLMPFALFVSDGSVLLGGFVLRYLVIMSAVPVLLT